MNKLQAQLRRLFLLSHPTGDGMVSGEAILVSPDGYVRAMVLELARPADWTALSILWQGIQADMGLPAPAIAVSGIDGFQLWFSLSEPVPVVEARRFLEYSRQRYLSAIAPGRIVMHPSAETALSGQGAHAKVVPAVWDTTGRWSAFVAPDLAALFSDEPWLDICPSVDAQADVLSRIKSIKAIDFQTVLAQIRTAVTTVSSHKAPILGEGGVSNGPNEQRAAASPENALDPKRFLLNVMGDESIELRLRIQAAQALLPYFESGSSPVT